MKNFFLRFVLLATTPLLVSSVSIAQWVRTNVQSGSAVYALAVSGTKLFAGTNNGGVFFSDNNGAAWSAIKINPGFLPVLSLTIIGNNLFAGTPGGAFLSTDNGTTWTAINNGLTNTDVRCFAVLGANLFAGTNGGGVFLSNNNGTTWIAISNGLTNTDVRCFAVLGTNLFAGTYGGGVFLSTNNGTSWTEVNTGLSNQRISSLTVSGTNLYAGSVGGVWILTDNGTTWTATSTGLPIADVLSIVVSGTNLFAGTAGGGVFLSTNDGTSWTDASNGLTSKNVQTLVILGSSLFAGTDDVWKRPLSEMITKVDPEIDHVPNQFNLEQNYPNPFNPSTAIKFSIPSVGTQHAVSVQLKIYDLLGREVATLVNEEKAPGNYEVKFDGTGLSNGVYFYKLQSADPSLRSGHGFSETKKLILLK